MVKAEAACVAPRWLAVPACALARTKAWAAYTASRTVGAPATASHSRIPAAAISDVTALSEADATKTAPEVACIRVYADRVAATATVLRLCAVRSVVAESTAATI